jgi:hypothetical protein
MTWIHLCLIGLLALGVLASLLLNLWSLRENQQRDQRHAAELEQLRFQFGEQRAINCDLLQRMQQMEVRPATGEAISLAGAPPSLNWSKRIQALRMFRRGDAPETIAAALSIPECEIRLLLKIERAAA